MENLSTEIVAKISENLSVRDRTELSQADKFIYKVLTDKRALKAYYRGLNDRGEGYQEEINGHLGLKETQTQDLFRKALLECAQSCDRYPIPLDKIKDPVLIEQVVNDRDMNATALRLVALSEHASAGNLAKILNHAKVDAAGPRRIHLGMVEDEVEVLSARIFI
jgi:hypothetical protein